MKLKAMLLGAVSCLIILGLGCSLSSSPSKVAKQFWELVEKGDIEGSTRLLSKKQTDKIGKDISRSKTAFTNLQRRIKDSGGIKSIEIQKEDILGENAEVTANIQLGEEKEAIPFKHKLVKENGEWKVEEWAADNPKLVEP